MEVRANWLAIKAEEAKKKGKTYSILGQLPKSLPALQRAFRVGERASRVNFDWERAEDVWEKIAEEGQEFMDAVSQGNGKAMAEEMGDLLFTVANLSRLLAINPEDALHDAVDKFVDRFYSMEEIIRQKGKRPADSSFEEMQEAWSAVKDREAGR